MSKVKEKGQIQCIKAVQANRCILLHKHNSATVNEAAAIFVHLIAKVFAQRYDFFF